MIKKSDILKSKLSGDTVTTTAKVNLRSGPGTNYTIINTVHSGKNIGWLVGYYRYVRNGYTWYLVKLWTPIQGHTVGWLAKGYFSYQKITVTKSGTKAMIKQLVANDVTIYKRLLTALVVLSRLKKLGYDVSQYTALAKKLTIRYNNRQKLLRESNALQVIDYGSEAYQKIRDAVIQSSEMNGRQWGFRGLGELGAAPVVIALAVGAVIGIAVSITLYYLFKPKYDESTKDLKISAALKQALDTLPEDQRKKVTANLEHQIDEAYNQGKTDQAFGSLFTIGKYILIGVVAYKGLELISEHTHKPQSQPQPKSQP